MQRGMLVTDRLPKSLPSLLADRLDPTLPWDNLRNAEFQLWGWVRAPEARPQTFTYQTVRDSLGSEPKP